MLDRRGATPGHKTCLQALIVSGSMLCLGQGASFADHHQADGGHDSHAQHQADSGHDSHAQHQADGGHDSHVQHQADSGHDSHAQHQAGMEMAPSVQPADVKLLNLPVLDQTGTALNFVDDVVGDKIVVFDFIFTSCTTICPVTTTLLTRSRADLQDVAPDRLQFVSLSIDSNNDDPERLARFAAQRSADWVFLTGEKRTMDELLVALDAYTTNPEDHAPMIIIGDAATGTFSRHFGMPNPDMVTRRVRELLQARAAQHDHHAGH